MSSYGPPGGPYPGEQPWPDQQRSPHKQSPSDPWADQPSFPPPAHPPISPAQYGGYGTGYEQAEWGEPQPVPAPPPPPDLPATNTRQMVLMVVVVALALLLGIGGFTAFLLSNDPTGQAQPGSSPTPSAAPTTAGTVAPTGEFRSVKAGQCLVNDGTDDDPKIRLVACTPGTYEVLKRFDGTIDYEKNCATVPGYQFHFFYDSNLDTLDFVLCMRKR